MTKTTFNLLIIVLLIVPLQIEAGWFTDREDQEFLEKQYIEAAKQAQQEILPSMRKNII